MKTTPETAEAMPHVGQGLEATPYTNCIRDRKNFTANEPGQVLSLGSEDDVHNLTKHSARVILNALQS